MKKAFVSIKNIAVGVLFLCMMLSTGSVFAVLRPKKVAKTPAKVTPQLPHRPAPLQPQMLPQRPQMNPADAYHRTLRDYIGKLVKYKAMHDQRRLQFGSPQLTDIMTTRNNLEQMDQDLTNRGIRHRKLWNLPDWVLALSRQPQMLPQQPPMIRGQMDDLMVGYSNVEYEGYYGRFASNPMPINVRTQKFESFLQSQEFLDCGVFFFGEWPKNLDRLKAFQSHRYQAENWNNLISKTGRTLYHNPIRNDNRPGKGIFSDGILAVVDTAKFSYHKSYALPKELFPLGTHRGFAHAVVVTPNGKNEKIGIIGCHFQGGPDVQLDKKNQINRIYHFINHIKKQERGDIKAWIICGDLNTTKPSLRNTSLYIADENGELTFGDRNQKLDHMIYTHKYLGLNSHIVFPNVQHVIYKNRNYTNAQAGDQTFYSDHSAIIAGFSLQTGVQPHHQTLPTPRPAQPPTMDPNEKRRLEDEIAMYGQRLNIYNFELNNRANKTVAPNIWNQLNNEYHDLLMRAHRLRPQILEKLGPKHEYLDKVRDPEKPGQLNITPQPVTRYIPPAPRIPRAPQMTRPAPKRGAKELKKLEELRELTDTANSLKASIQRMEQQGQPQQNIGHLRRELDRLELQIMNLEFGLGIIERD